MSFLRLHYEDEDLLPGIPNEITLDHIVPKLIWREFHALSSISHPWQQAIQSHQVHDARVRSNSIDTLVVIRLPKKSFLTLYSVREDCYHRLPEIPHLATGGIPWAFQCVSLDGKIYVFGGWQHDKDNDCKELYVLDVAGQRKWKQCASMETPRSCFRCGAIGGKIYVFAGVHEGKSVQVSEVYDPKEDCWSRVSPSPSRRFYYSVATLGEELVLFGGLYLHGDDDEMYAEADSDLEVYHPGKDEWRVIGPFKAKHSGQPFMARGKFHVLTSGSIDVYDLDNNTWSHLHSLNYSSALSSFGRVLSFRVAINSVLVVNGEILVKACLSDEVPERTLLLRSQGFGSDKATLMWEAVKCPTPLAELSIMCTLQL